MTKYNCSEIYNVTFIIGKVLSGNVLFGRNYFMRINRTFLLSHQVWNFPRIDDDESLKAQY